MGQTQPLLNLTEESVGYLDYFGQTFSVREPLIMSDGTSVVFPKGWTDEDADKWRKGKQLQRQSANCR